MIVFLFFFIIFLILIIFKLRIVIEELELLNCSNLAIKVYIELILFKNIKILKYKLKDDFTNKIKDNIKISNIKKENKKKKINIKKLDIKINIGTEDFVLTTSLVVLISSIISIIHAKSNNTEFKYLVVPEYSNKNVFKIWINCIVDIKMIHIIYILYYLIKNYLLNKKIVEKSHVC